MRNNRILKTDYTTVYVSLKFLKLLSSDMWRHVLCYTSSQI
jgi:hypothetical protein